MSIPHTGELTAIVNGFTCRFDGDNWITPSADLTAILNDATESTPKTHYSIREIAENVLNKVGLLKDAKILSDKSASWMETIPDDAVE